MARRYKKRSRYNPDNEFDEVFTISGRETFSIDDQEIEVEDAVHAIKDGQEYVIIDDQLFPVDRPDEEDEYVEEPFIQNQQSPLSSSSSSGLGRTGIIILGIVAGLIISLVAGPAIIGLASGLVDTDNTNIISPNGDQEISPSPEPTKMQSSESQTATKIKNAMDYTNPVTRDFAVSLIPNSHEGNYNIAQICDLWDTVYNKWTYVNDPQGSEYFSPASRTIRLGLKGDCDDFAITVGSIVQSIGGSTRVVTAYNAKSGHAYPEVLVCKSEACIKKVASYISKRYKSKGIAYHTRTKDGVTQYWLNLDWQSRQPGGNFFHDSGELTFYYPNGYWYTST